jgi:hypothetical protein
MLTFELIVSVAKLQVKLFFAERPKSAAHNHAANEPINRSTELLRVVVCPLHFLVGLQFQFQFFAGLESNCGNGHL